jgi:hypothetical protein
VPKLELMVVWSKSEWSQRLRCGRTVGVLQRLPLLLPVVQVSPSGKASASSPVEARGDRLVGRLASKESTMFAPD